MNSSEICDEDCCRLTAEYNAECILSVGQHLTELRARVSSGSYLTRNSQCFSFPASPYTLSNAI